MGEMELHDKITCQKSIIQTFLHNRHLEIEDIDYLLNPSKSHQHDPFLLRDVDKWIDILHECKDKVIAIVPDYDADGVMSGTLARVGLHILGFKDPYVYPPRMLEGFGLSKKSIDNVLHAQPDTQVIITTDNGSGAYDGVAYAKSKGIVVLVTDHHLAYSDPVADAIVNPNRRSDDLDKQETYPYVDISGTAVIYKVLLAYAEKYNKNEQVLYDLESLILLVGISTISDMMPVLNENRYFVQESVNMLKRFVDSHTLDRIYQYEATPLGDYHRGVDLLVGTLLKNKKLNYGIDSDTFGFLIGPILNCPRRMVGTSELAFSLFQVSHDDLRNETGLQPGDLLYNMNESRKTYTRGLTSALFKHINHKIESGVCESPIEFCVFNARMGGGIAGLLAGSFTQDFGLPSISFSVPVDLADNPTNQDFSDIDNLIDIDPSSCTEISGSGRSPEWFDLHAFLTKIDLAHPGLILGWGGHAQAAGISIRSKDYETFKTIFVGLLERHIMALRELADKAQHARCVDIGESGHKLTVSGEYLLVDKTARMYEAYIKPVDKCHIVLVCDETPVMEQEALRSSVEFFEALSPYGQGLSRALFSVVIQMNDVGLFYMGAKKQHVKFTLSNGLSIIQWNDAELYKKDVEHTEDGLAISDNRAFILTGELSINEYANRKSLQMVVKDSQEIS